MRAFFRQVENSLSTVDIDFGKRLQKAREARKLSVEEAARATRMRPAYIDALESGTLSKFPNAAYAKSFLLMYGKYLGVDVVEVANMIDTSVQVGVSDFQYLSSRAEEDKERQKAAADSRYDFVVAKQESKSWWPLVVGGAVVALAVTGGMVWMNLSRIADADLSSNSTTQSDKASPSAPAELAAKRPTANPDAAAAQVASTVKNPTSPALNGQPGAALNPPNAAPQPAAPAIPRAVVVSNGVVQNMESATASTIARSRAAAPVPSLAANDSELLADIAVPARQPTGVPGVSEVSVNKDAADVVFLEPRKKTWVVIRSGPGGQPLFEDYLYPNVRPMKLPPGRYYIELREADAVAIVRNGKRISYVAPGVMVQ